VVQILFIGESFDWRFEPKGSHFLHLPFSGMKVKEGRMFKAVLYKSSSGQSICFVN
jgi:hypothetical protein